MGLGERVGSIEVGKSADFLVLSQNLFDIDARWIHETNVLATYLRGTRVYDANSLTARPRAPGRSSHRPVRRSPGFAGSRSFAASPSVPRSTTGPIPICLG
ncbi:amidohydrolase family protein [Saccharopolyspora shandongensis]|uniref:amidohydrolase family protein n=1 Tax=Saccharopolyspora shandongensis TaxID=418495 RepID=UPI00341C867E